MSYIELFPLLLQNSLVVPCPIKPVEPPYPRGYDTNSKCDYHAGAIGHSLENCRALKFKVQSLIKAGWLSFKEDNPNIGNNPLPGHGGPIVNSIEENKEQLMIRRVKDVKTPLNLIFEEMCKFGMLVGSHGKDEGCGLHPGKSHKIDECDEFKQILQDLMDKQIIQVGYSESHVWAMDSNVGFPKPLVVHYTRGKNILNVDRPKPITIQVPRAFPYKDNKVVPWRYGAKVCIDASEERLDATDITNVAGIGGMTRSGRIYTLEELKIKQAKEVEKSHEKGKEVVDERVIKEQEEEKKEVSNEEAYEFLKLIRQSEYTVIDQLNRISSRISLLSLMTNSEPHRRILLKILNEAHVVHDISEEKFEGIVGNITANNYLTFTDDEIPEERAGHNRALHISVK
ncbi:uncharacterized protein LOC109803801 [Cajanus cajan]|uniref:uncharacterized protein LOC109803801 n=1 Tax=Cajanus cajan TaxID=3821 RepID=UPI00098D823D|nr:uncharacterized protein LOC109803801 [Cajanus cajan]